MLCVGSLGLRTAARATPHRLHGSGVGDFDRIVPSRSCTGSSRAGAHRDGSWQKWMGHRQATSIAAAGFRAGAAAPGASARAHDVAVSLHRHP